MIKYICKECNNLECETSVCPVCGTRAESKESVIYWCKKCNIPTYAKTCPNCLEEGESIGTDLRPVFPQERLLLEILTNKEFEYAEKSIWNTSGNYYIVNGEKIKFSMKEAMKKNSSQSVIAKIYKLKLKNKQYEENFYHSPFIVNFIKANKIRLNEIMTEAIQYIRKCSERYCDDEMFISFSGGKDSTVTSDIVMKALGKENIIHIYGNTTLEYDETFEYLKKFREIHPRTPVLIAQNKDQDFNELCKVIGPPSRMMRWCCTIFKTGAITRKIESTFKDKKNILTFQGIRRSESATRNKYDRMSNESKIKKQTTIAPLLDWLDFDVWLYILSNQIEFNTAYRLGFSRVGCWCCPNNSEWSEYLSSIYMPDKYQSFHTILEEFATEIGKPDPEEYVKNGGWKARQGGNGVEYSKNTLIEVKPCALIENTLSFALNKPLDENLYELFKPFGTLNFVIGNKRLNEIFILHKKTNEPILKISGKLRQKEVKITVVKFIGIFKDMKVAETLIKNQITKYQACIGCLACESQCKYNAIKITNIGKEQKINYKIDENKCIGCLECVKHFSDRKSTR